MTDVECLSTTYDEFIESIEDNPYRAVAFMRTLVRRLRQMNALMEKVDPNRRGLRGFVSDVQKGAAPARADAEAVNLSWTTLW
jgi:CRP-like cAMP-binding protein